jgi:hypothetical protein
MTLNHPVIAKHDANWLLDSREARLSLVSVVFYKLQAPISDKQLDIKKKIRDKPS